MPLVHPIDRNLKTAVLLGQAALRNIFFMAKTKLVYIWSLRNACADRAGQSIEYKGGLRYMQSVLENLVLALNETALGDAYSLEGVIFDDDASLPADQAKLAGYGLPGQTGGQRLYPSGQKVQGRQLDDLLIAVPSTYRRYALGAPERVAGKSEFEARVRNQLDALGAELVVLDGLLIILDELVRPGAPYARKIVNIHPGITRIESPYERRGAYATLDALYGAHGEKVVDWATRQTRAVEPRMWTGASFHYVDNGVDSGEVIADVLGTQIDPQDTILELRWNNFNRSVFPALRQGLAQMAGIAAPVMEGTAA